MDLPHSLPPTTLSLVIMFQAGACSLPIWECNIPKDTLKDKERIPMVLPDGNVKFLK